MTEETKEVKVEEQVEEAKIEEPVEETKVEEPVEEAKVEKPSTEVVVEVPAEVMAKVGPIQKTPEEASKDLQGKKKTSKKKISHYNKVECLAEIERLEKAGHKYSKYYQEVKKRALSLS